MTEQQQEYINETWEEIQRLPGADLVLLDARGITLIRMEYIPKNKYYEITSIGAKCGREEIRRRMFDIFHKLMKAVGKE